MKKIKPVVLKNTTRLTNSQMKEIRGGIIEIPPKPTKCSLQCESGAVYPEIEFDCGFIPGAYCEASATLGIICYSQNGDIYPANKCEYELPID